MLWNTLSHRLALPLAGFFAIGILCCSCSSSPPEWAKRRAAKKVQPSRTERMGSATSKPTHQPVSTSPQPILPASGKEITIMPRVPRLGETLRVEGASEDPASRPFLSYQWFVNGEENPGWKGDTFSGNFKRGDEVSVVVSHPDGSNTEPPLTASLKIGNSPPAVEKLTTPRFDGQKYQTQIVATDPDGDPLAFSIVQAPAGLGIDGDGRITWNPGESDLGKHDVTVSVKDDAGGEIVYTYSFSVDRQ